MFRPRSLTVIAAMLLVAAGCSSDSDDTGDADPTTTVAPDDAPSSGTDDPDGSAVVVAASPLVAPLDQEYPAGGLFPSGSVSASWYQSDGRYVVVYTGLDLDGIGPACPGNSIQLADGSFSSVSNAPTAEGGCAGATTPTPSTPPRICGDLIVYTTAIDSTEQGLLFGTFERQADGGFVGATSTVATDGTSAPDIDTTADSYDVEGVEHTC